ncbi:MAG: oxidoreductase [Gracilibacter sp. BRH_c7a]|nr:MAG: oxidoreductase [Gracilibacter sp. BRH_c7a]
MILKERVIENRIMGDPIQMLYKMVISGQAAQTATPGQFVHLQVADSNEPLLRRPLSIAGIDKNTEEVTIYYKVIGKGTELLTRIKENEYISVLGPLGTGFTVPDSGELLLVAGGIGIFPLLSLIQAVDKEKVKLKLLWGGENKQFIESAGLIDIEKMGVNLDMSTLDGSLGTKGLVTDLLESYLGDNTDTIAKPKDNGKQNLRVATCGPKGMLQAVTKICLGHNVPVEVSLEERMACGIGACLGCVCTVKDLEGNLKRKRVCKEGPVMDGKEVVWDE